MSCSVANIFPSHTLFDTKVKEVMSLPMLPLCYDKNPRIYLENKTEYNKKNQTYKMFKKSQIQI